MTTAAVYWQNPYCHTVETTVVSSQKTDNGVMAAFAETIFYPHGGGQPGDSGQLHSDGPPLAIINTGKDRTSGIIWHQLAGNAPPAGTKVTLTLDWPRRYNLMRTHTAMHLLCAAVKAPVTGCNLGELRGRIDFDSHGLPAKPPIEKAMNDWVCADAAVSARWVEESELDAKPELVRTMSVSPPRGCGKVRLVCIAGVDLQACGGTHVARTGEIGVVSIVKVENKGRINRRVVFTIADC